MPKPKLIRSDTLPYHVWARSNNQDWFYLPIEHVWEIACVVWQKVIENCGVQIRAFVLMSNHFHAVLQTPNANIDSAMRYFLRETARKINCIAGRINHVYGGPYGSSLIGSEEYYLQVLRYVYQNPVKANICLSVEDYKYSSIYYEYRGLDIPYYKGVEMEANARAYTNSQMKWLNELLTLEQRDRIRRGLKLSVFSPKKDRNKNRIQL